MPEPTRPAQGIRKFLVVVDDTPECRVALRFACRRARKTQGGVTLVRVIEPADFQHWAAVGNLMREEARAEAETLLQSLAADVNHSAGVIPEL
ncbi:MAG: universal stress protein, partial [Alphaproteobacteria bacterium]|nr:universal stress protein [Alphaproteobacteria bacterium]